MIDGNDTMSIPPLIGGGRTSRAYREQIIRLRWQVDWLVRYAAQARGETCAETREAMEREVPRV